MNYDGKILPCRAKVKKCPYEIGRHGDSYEDLYPKVMEHYNNVQSDESLVNELKTGAPLRGFNVISKQLETSKSPMETMIATLGLALNTIDSGKMPSEYVRMKDQSVKAAYEIYKIGKTPPSYLPESMRSEAYQKWIRDGSPREYPKVGENTGITYNNVSKDIVAYQDSYLKFEQWESTHSQLSDENKRLYKAGLTTDFNNYSKVLNTSKQIMQPDWADSDSVENINNNLDKMSSVELMSLYDDLSVSDKEISNNLKEINYFSYKRRSDLSDAANDNIEKWYAQNRELAQKSVLRSSERILLSMRVSRELMSRDVAFGDTLRATTEREV